MISTRGRYALRILIDLAESGGDAFVPLRQLSLRQEISLKYIEAIMPSIVAEGLVVSSPGKGGGYRLARKPEEISIRQVLAITDNLSPVACLACPDKGCGRASECRTLPLWKELDALISGFLSAKTLSDYMRGEKTV